MSAGRNLRTALRNVAIDPRNNAIAIHRRAGIFGGDEDVGLSRFFWNEKTEACLMDRQFAGDEIGFRRKDVAILPNAYDFARVFEFIQNLSHLNTVTSLCVKRLRDFVSIQRSVIGRAQERENLFSNCPAVFVHLDETIMEDVDLTMKTILSIGCAFAATAAIAFAAGGGKMKITSSAFQEGGTISEKFSKNGQNVNPELRIDGAPAEAKSLALIVDDPDAPVGLFTHWLVWNIDPKTTEIAEGSVPQGGVQGTNDFPGQRYDGPQPPSGTHRYYFKVFALDKTLDLKPGAKRKEVDAAMKGHVIAQGQLMGKYSKK
jgi:Raf kinase inhibitor-like YbhB/YbcL family protein